MIVDAHVHIQQIPPFAPVGPTAPSFTSRPTEAATAEMLLGEMDYVVPEIGQAAGWELGDSGSPFGFGAVT